MQNQPLVSVIVPVYNVDLYLKRCVKSIQAQSYAHLEIILINDGSKDDSGKICDQFALEDERVVVIHQENRGLGSARNSGLDAMTGEWLCFVDSDDFVAPRYVEALLGICLEHDCVTAQCRYAINYDGRVVKNENDCKVETMNWRDYYRYVRKTDGHSANLVWHNIYHRSVFENIRFPRIKFEDLPIAARTIYASRRKHLGLTSEVLYFYFNREGSLSYTITPDYPDIVRSHHITISFWKDKGETEIYEEAWNLYYSALLRTYVYCAQFIPEHHESFSHLYSEIIEGLEKAKRCMNPTIEWLASRFCQSINLWKTIICPDSKIIIYGLGREGKKLLTILNQYGANIIEIWDKRAAEIDTRVDIPIKTAHASAGKDAIILITILNAHAIPSVRQDLEQMGYLNIICGEMLNNAINSKLYQEHLPILRNMISGGVL